MEGVERYAESLSCGFEPPVMKDGHVKIVALLPNDSLFAPRIIFIVNTSVMP